MVHYYNLRIYHLNFLFYTF